MDKSDFLEHVSTISPVTQMLILIAAILLLLFEATRDAQAAPHLTKLKKSASDFMSALYLVGLVLLGAFLLLAWIVVTLSCAVFRMLGHDRKRPPSALSDSSQARSIGSSTLSSRKGE